MFRLHKRGFLSLITHSTSLFIKNLLRLYPPVQDCGLPRDYLDSGAWSPRLVPLLEDQEIVNLAKNDTIPIPRPEDRIQYFKNNHLDYWLSGILDAKTVCDFAGRSFSGPILDFGGSTGRVIRHMRYFRQNDDLYLCDTNPKFIHWAKRYLWPSVKSFKNEYYPTLAFDNNTFGLIYAFSVFTHINEHELGWLLELRRVLRDDGKLLVTIHNEHTWDLIPSLKFRISTEILPGSPSYVEYCKKNTEAPDRAVFIYKDELTNVFYSNQYIKKYWGEYFNIETIVDEAHNYQAMVIMSPK